MLRKLRPSKTKTYRVVTEVVILTTSLVAWPPRIKTLPASSVFCSFFAVCHLTSRFSSVTHKFHISWTEFDQCGFSQTIGAVPLLNSQLNSKPHATAGGRLDSIALDKYFSFQSLKVSGLPLWTNNKGHIQAHHESIDSNKHMFLSLRVQDKITAMSENRKSGF